MSSKEVKQFLDLNDYCLLEIMKYCDFVSLASLADSCQQLNQLIHRFVFTTIKVYKCEVNPNTSLNQTRRIIVVFCSMIYVESLCIEIKDQGMDRTSYTNYLLPLLNKLGTSIGERISFLKISSCYLPLEWMIALNPILKNVETLSVIATRGITYEIDDCSVNFPRLKHLHIEGYLSINFNDLQLESLETFVFQTLCDKIFTISLKAAPQLKRLKGFLGYFLYKIDSFKNFLPNLEELVLCGPCEQCPENVFELKHFKKLRYLQLIRIDRNLFECLSRWNES